MIIAEKAIAWRSVSCKMTCYTYQTKISMNSQSAFCTSSAFCIERIGIAVFVCSLHFVLNGLVLLCLFEQASSLDRNIGAWKKFSENILAATIDLWPIYKKQIGFFWYRWTIWNMYNVQKWFIHCHFVNAVAKRKHAYDG